MFENVKTCIINATEYLGYNSLRFGDIDSSLEEQLENLIAQVKTCIEMSEGVTATIRAKAETQYQEYQEYLRSLETAKKDTTTEL